jgi:prepilin-type N-terminal cleavage/methylation domain-containing protein
MIMRRPRSQRGFTLIELMVSLTLFSLAIAGVLAVAVSMAQGYREQRQVVQTEGNARSALDFIADAIRMASPGVANPDVTFSDAAPTVPLPHLAIGDIEDTETAGPGACARGAVRVFNNNTPTGTDALEIVFASGATVSSIGAASWSPGGLAMQITDTTNFAPGDHILITNGARAHIAKIVTIASPGNITVNTGTCAVSLPTTYNQGDLVIRVHRARFYIGTFDSITPVLIMDPDGDGPDPAEPLADYVEDMQIAAGVDEDQDGAIGPLEWGYSGVPSTPALFNTGRDLRAIRITLISRAATILPGTPNAWRREAVEDHAAALTFDAFRRRTLTSTVEIRNLPGSP